MMRVVEPLTLLDGWLVFDASPTPMALAAPDLRIVRHNAAFRRALGIEEDHTGSLHVLELTHPDDHEAIRTRVAEALRSDHGGYVAHTRFSDPAGGPVRRLHVTVSVLRPPDGTPLLLAQVEDSTERVAASERLERLADRDHLTGLLNRRRLEEEVDREIAAARRHEHHSVLLVLDVDHFKAVNDAGGHAAGDRVLARVAAQLVGRVRCDDVVARLGGDEFAILLRGIGTEEAAKVGADLVALIGEARDESLHEAFAITVSIGIRAVDRTTPSTATAMHDADLAMYAAKAGGRDRVVVHAGPPGVDPLEAQTFGPTVATPVPTGLLAELKAVAERPGRERVLRAVRELLGIDVAYATIHTDTEQVLIAVEGDADSFGVGVGTRIPLEDTYCQQVLDGRLPNVMPDLTAEPAAAAMPITAAARVAAYASVAIRLSDGTLHGTLCAANHEPLIRLGVRDHQFLEVLARILADEVEREAAAADRLALSAQAAGAAALLSAVEARDAYTGEHSRKVVTLAAEVARVLELDATALAQVASVALLHDVGKLAVPDAILGKEGPLTPDEQMTMRRHPVDGAAIVASVPDLAELAPAVRAEHERWDGTGYPDGLRGEAIPIASRIAFVCDAWHAMTSDRPYRAALSRERAIAELAAGAGSQFCPACVRALLGVLAGR